MKKLLLTLLLLSSCGSFDSIESSLFSSESSFQESISDTISVSEAVVMDNESMFMIRRTYNTNNETFTEDDGYLIMDYYDPTDLEDGVSQYYAYFRYVSYIDQDNKYYEIGYGESGSYFDLDYFHALTEFYLDNESQEYINNNMTYEVNAEITFEGTLNDYLDFITLQVVYQENANMDVELFIDKFYTIFAPVLNISWSF